LHRIERLVAALDKPSVVMPGLDRLAPAIQRTKTPAQNG
jgi:hypothetical protein